jgi:hypothetical protein
MPTWAGVNLGQEFQVRTQAVEVGGVPHSLQDQHQLADALGERLRVLVLQHTQKYTLDTAEC